MKILIISQWYYPEPVGKPHELASELVKSGHQVTVITGFPNYPSGQVYPGYRVRLFAWETIDGVCVLRVGHLIDRSCSALRRILSYLSFTLVASALGTFLLDRPDIIWTYQIGLPGVLLSIVKRAPLVHEVQDLWPDWGLSATSGLTRWLHGVLIAQEKLIYRWAATVTTISQGFRCTLLTRGVPASKIQIIPNWANDQNFRPVARDLALGIRENLTDRFNVMYGGNVGAAQRLGVVLEAATLLQDLPEVQFVIIGDGVEREVLADRVQTQKLTNVRFLGSRPPDQMAWYFAFADVLFLHLAQDTSYAITIPSKTYAYLASGRPILAAADGDVADLISETGAGVSCPPEDPTALAKAVRQLYTLSMEQRDVMGQAGHRAFQAHFTRLQLVARYETLLFRLSKQQEKSGTSTEADSLAHQNTMSIRLARQADVPSIVTVHQAGFPGFFLTILGSTFLRELYTATLADPDGIGFVVEEISGITGFIIGTTQPAGFYRRLIRQRWWRFALASVPPVFKRPLIIPRLLRAFAMPSQSTQQAARGTLMSIAVLPDRQSSGVGKTLMNTFLQEAARRGLHHVDLTTDQDHNEAANRFYQKLGFVCTRSFTTPEGRVMNEYVIDLPISSNEKQSKSYVSIPPQGEYIA